MLPSYHAVSRRRAQMCTTRWNISLEKSTVNILSNDPYAYRIPPVYGMTFDAKRFISSQSVAIAGETATHRVALFSRKRVSFRRRSTTTIVVVHVTSVSVLPRPLPFLKDTTVLLSSISVETCSSCHRFTPPLLFPAPPPCHSLRGLLNFLSFPEEIRSIYFGGSVRVVLFGGRVCVCEK